MIFERRAGPTRYLQAGEGSPVVLLHAFPMGADMWRPQLHRVPEGSRFIAPDLLVIDDLGLRPLTDHEPEDLFEIIRLRYEKGAIIIDSTMHDRVKRSRPGRVQISPQA